MKLMTPPPGLETRHFIMEPDALRQLPAILRQYWQSDKVWTVADGNTWPVAGNELQAALVEGGFTLLPPFLFPGTPTLDPDIAHARELIEAMPDDAIPVVVGSGTLNDLLKYAASERGRPYLVIPTAPSVDGYNASGAALTVEGFKKTVPCPAPLAVVADPAIMATAPQAMFAAGYADLLAKIPAGADWIVADYLGLAPIRTDVWLMVQTPLRSWLAPPPSVEQTFMGLVATGYAMQMCNDSRPASGAEHLISHTWEMEGVVASHGFKVGLATLMTTAVYEKLLPLNSATLQQLARPGLSREQRLHEIERLIGSGGHATAIRDVAMSKFLTGPELAARREQLYDGWDNLRHRVAAQLLPFAEVRERLKSVAAPVTPAAIGVDREQFVTVMSKAQLIRNRHTVLDLVYELGLSLDYLASEIYTQLTT